MIHKLLVDYPAYPMVITHNGKFCKRFCTQNQKYMKQELTVVVTKNISRTTTAIRRGMKNTAIRKDDSSRPRCKVAGDLALVQFSSIRNFIRKVF